VIAAALIVSVILLALRGIETRGRGLEEISSGSAASAPAMGH
jgi:hypothetical protein